MPSDPDKRVETRPTGLYERLLCRSCEDRLKVHEDYVRKFLYGGAGFYAEKIGNNYLFSGLKYVPVRLCYLSILWRMSISRLSTFNAVSLGPHEENLRTLIINDDPGRVGQYGFLSIIPFLDGELIPDLILQPGRIKCDGHIIYRMVIGGLLFMFMVSSHRVAPEIEQAFIQPDGTWLMHGTEVKNIPFLYEWFIKTSASQKQRGARKAPSTLGPKSGTS